jgi:glycosidase
MMIIAMVVFTGGFSVSNHVVAENLSKKQVDSNTIPDNTIRIHYERTDQNYDNWGLWLWNDVAIPSAEAGVWPTGATPFSNTQVDENGAYVDVELIEAPTSISFIVVNRSTGEKDGDAKVFAQFGEYKEVFITEGDDFVYTSPDGSSNVEKSKTFHPNWSKDSTIYEVNIRQYTPEGTFKAFESHLPRLKELGVEILWFMPIHPISSEGRIGTLGSYYAIQDYKAINPEFGTLDDFKRLVDKAHSMGFKVMLDWVGNHTGKDHIWTENKEWYTLDNEGNITHPPGTNWLDVADLNFNNTEMRTAMIDAMKYWVSETDIDGYRADYAVGVPLDFWETARKELNKIKPVYMLAEDNTVYNLLDHAFNSNYGWELNHIMRDIAIGNRDATHVKSYISKMERLYPSGSYPMHWTTNHDDNSWEGTTSELFGESEKTMAALTFTLPGMPLIYSGQEAGLNKRLAFFDKDEISWQDLSDQKFYQDLIRLKKENKALWNGDAGGEINLLDTSDENILAFERQKGNSKVMVIVNLSADPNSGSVTVDSKSVGNYHLFPSKETVSIENKQPFDLEPWEYHILVK